MKINKRILNKHYILSISVFFFWWFSSLIIIRECNIFACSLSNCGKRICIYLTWVNGTLQITELGSISHCSKHCYCTFIHRMPLWFGPWHFTLTRYINRFTNIKKYSGRHQMLDLNCSAFIFYSLPVVTHGLRKVTYCLLISYCKLFMYGVYLKN